MRLGDNGSNVRNLQSALSGLGYPLAADGDFGPRTDEMVRKFQLDSHLKDDGIVGPMTMEKLRVLSSGCELFKVPKPQMSWVYCPADKFPGRAGYKGMRLRTDAAAAYGALYEEVRGVGLG